MNRYLTVSRLEFVVTYLCNSRCRHCQLGDTRAKEYPANINSDLAVEIVRKVAGKYRHHT